MAKQEPERQIRPAVGNGNDARLAMYEQIADGADAKRADEIEDIDENAWRAQLDDDEPEQIEDDVQPEPEPDPERLFTIKVNGKTLQLTEAELIARAQKVEAADEYLKSASEAVRNATSLALSPQRDAPAEPEIDPRQLARQLQMGDEEEAAAAVQALMRPSVTPDDVVRQVTQQLSLREELALMERQYEKTVKHPVLGTVFQDRLRALIANPATRDMTVADAYAQIDGEIREQFAPMLVDPTEVRKVSKQERKAQMSSVPTAAGRQALVEDDGIDDSPEAVIAAMARSRHQGRPIQH